MLTEPQLNEIRSYLEKSIKPLFFFDDDPDGLTSFLLLRRKYGKGHGIPVKSAPKSETIYIRKIKEYGPDIVFILDRPIISQDLIDSTKVPIIWIDHHEPVQRQGAHYYNPRLQEPADSKPTSYWCYKTVGQDMWIALIGIIGDYFIPEFVNDFEHKELLGHKLSIPEILYESEFGKLIKIYAFIIKGKTTEVRKCINILLRINSPYEILGQKTPAGKYIYKRFEKINKQYEALLTAASASQTSSDLFVFTYPSSKMSFTGALSNELLYRLQNKLILIAREKDGEFRISIRSKFVKVLPILKNALVGIAGYGGGHDYACGANIESSDFQKFVKNLENELK